MACLTAVAARFSPEALQIPIWHTPAFVMTRRTSARSRLMSPGIATRSEMPATPNFRTWSAILNASSIDVSSSVISRSLSFATTMRESTYFSISRMPRSAFCRRRGPSNRKGFVTTATVRIPSSRAICATTGAAPVPVPQPIPAVIKSISVPRIACAISSLDSSAAFSPILGSAPQPNPLVIFSPI